MKIRGLIPELSPLEAGSLADDSVLKSASMLHLKDRRLLDAHHSWHSASLGVRGRGDCAVLLCSAIPCQVRPLGRADGTLQDRWPHLLRGYARTGRLFDHDARGT